MTQMKLQEWLKEWNKTTVFGNSGSLQKIVTHLFCLPYFTAATLLQLFSSLFLLSLLARDLCRSYGWSDPTSYSGWVTSYGPDSRFGKQCARCFQKRLNWCLIKIALSFRCQFLPDFCIVVNIGFVNHNLIFTIRSALSTCPLIPTFLISVGQSEASTHWSDRLMRCKLRPPRV